MISSQATGWEAGTSKTCADGRVEPAMTSTSLDEGCGCRELNMGLKNCWTWKQNKVDLGLGF